MKKAVDVVSNSCNERGENEDTIENSLMFSKKTIYVVREGKDATTSVHSWNFSMFFEIWKTILRVERCNLKSITFFTIIYKIFKFFSKIII